MRIKSPSGPVHFPTSSEHGPIPFPTSKSKEERRPATDMEVEAVLSAEELRLMADTMPGECPGD